jgi:aryl-alcohol dehydrogenase-like predicted oxidoreductase
MTFGQGPLVPGVNNRIDQRNADQMIARCLDAGVTLFDTADAYTQGESETILGRALGPHREEVVLCTKTGFRTSPSVHDVGLSRRRIIQAAQGSLRRLGTDHVDIYLIHIHDPYTPLEEVAEALNTIVDLGYSRYVGFSNLPAWVVARYVGLQERLHLARFSVGQVYYSLVGRDLELELAPCCESLGIGLMAWSPLAGGFLTGKYARERPAPAGSRREKFSLPPVDPVRGQAALAVLQDVAKQLGSTPAATALAWTLTKKFMPTVLIGANTLDQLVCNLKAGDLALSPAQVSALDEVSQPPSVYPSWMMPLAHDKILGEALG